VAEAREAYAAALVASPLHPRAAFGLAKLALTEGSVGTDAREALRRIIDDSSTPVNERARAAYHLAVLEARAGRRAEAAAAVARAPLDDAEARSWLERAVADQARSRGYHVPASTPVALQSASDDDPSVAPSRPTPSDAVSPTFRMPDPAPPPAPARHGSPAGHPPRPPENRAAPKATTKPAPAKAAPRPPASPKKVASKKVVATKAPAGKPAAKRAVATKPASKTTLAKKDSAAARRPTSASKPAPPSTQPPPEGSALERAMSKVR
jgi:hypothetical protein